MTSTTRPWFAVDKRGLKKLLERRGKSFAILELVQNAWDTSATEVDVEVRPVDGVPFADVTVTDNDPDGFAHLEHAYTLFAESTKKGDAEKRGRFNLGEKLVLALCSEATIASTKGAVVFDERGRTVLGQRRLEGSSFRGRMSMTRAEAEEVERVMRQLLPAVRTTFNGEALPHRPPIRTAKVTLPTDIADSEGVLRRTSRATTVSIHALRDDETPHLYEMGIPVVELTGGERWHINVHQKVPLTMDRDNVTPAYLRALRVAIANAMTDKLVDADGASLWLADATGDARCAPEAIARMLDLRFGAARVSYDPSDVEANKEAVNKAHTVVTGGSLTRDQWTKVREHGLIKPAGQVFPSGLKRSPNGVPVVPVLDPAPAMASFLAWASMIIRELRLSKQVSKIRIIDNPTIPALAFISNGDLTFNAGTLGNEWFDRKTDEADAAMQRQIELLVHELAHVFEADHLTHAYSDAAIHLGAAVACIAWRKPDLMLLHDVSVRDIPCSSQGYWSVAALAAAW